MTHIRRPGTLHGAIILAMAGIFAADLTTPADNVSIAFAFAIPIILSIQIGGPWPFVYALLGTVLSLLGSVIQPGGPTSAVFIANRVIAVITQWLVALLIHYRLRAEHALTQRLADEHRNTEMQRRLIAILSHEVRTPLTTIDGQAFRLAKRHDLARPDEIRTRSDKIRAAVRRVNDIIERIGLSSTVGAGDVILEPSGVNLRGLVLQAVQEVVDNAPQAQLDLDLAGLPASIPGDAGLLHHVVANLLANALQFSGDPAVVSVSGRVQGGEVVLAVADRGIGIDEDERKRIFAAYYRGRNSQGVSGAGIGLYLVDHFVRMHGGRVAVAPRTGGGTVFTIHLPGPALP